MKKLLIYISLVLVITVSVAEGGGIYGGWKPIKYVTDPSVVNIAKYAVSEYNKQSKTNLVFEKVVQGKEKVVSGKMYDLTIATMCCGGKSQNYEAVVWDKPFESFRKLESFKAV